MLLKHYEAKPFIHVLGLLFVRCFYCLHVLQQSPQHILLLLLPFLLVFDLLQLWERPF